MRLENLETCNGLILLSHKLDIKSLQYLEIVIVYILPKSTHLRVNF
jgi:hypothetical protein